MVIAGAFFAVNLTLAVLLLNFNGSRSAGVDGAEGSSDAGAAAKEEEEDDDGFDAETLEWIGQDHVAISVGLTHGGGGSRKHEKGDIALLAQALTAQADAEAAATVPAAASARPSWMDAPMPHALRRPHAFAWRRARLVGYRLITVRHFEGISFCVIMANTLIMCLTWCARLVGGGGRSAAAMRRAAMQSLHQTPKPS